MRLALILAAMACGSMAWGLGQDQLYTGTATTVLPGEQQFQFFYNATFAGARLTGSSVTFGATDNADVKIAYGHLWNDRGPNATLGPNIGGKWRFMGDGQRNTSMSLSGLYAVNAGRGQGHQKNDVGALLIFQHPTPAGWILVNVGRVWVGEDMPDLSYLALAFARPVSERTLAAVQYIDVSQIGQGPPGRQLREYIGALVFRADQRTGYSVQLACNPGGRNSKWNVTFGVSRYL